MFTSSLYLLLSLLLLLPLSSFGQKVTEWNTTNANSTVWFEIACVDPSTRCNINGDYFNVFLDPEKDVFLLVTNICGGEEGDAPCSVECEAGCFCEIGTSIGGSRGTFIASGDTCPVISQTPGVLPSPAPSSVPTDFTPVPSVDSNNAIAYDATTVTDEEVILFTCGTEADFPVESSRINSYCQDENFDFSFETLTAFRNRIGFSGCKENSCVVSCSEACTSCGIVNRTALWDSLPNPVNPFPTLRECTLAVDTMEPSMAPSITQSISMPSSMPSSMPQSAATAAHCSGGMILATATMGLIGIILF